MIVLDEVHVQSAEQAKKTWEAAETLNPYDAKVTSSNKLPEAPKKKERSTEQPYPIDTSKIDAKQREFWGREGWHKTQARLVRDVAVIIGARVPEATSMAFRTESWAGYCPMMCVLCPNGISIASHDMAQLLAERNGIVFFWTDDEDAADFEIQLREPRSVAKRP